MDAPVEKSARRLVRDDPTLHIKIGYALRKRLRTYATHYYMSNAEMVRIALIHYFDNHVDPTQAESLTLKER